LKICNLLKMKIYCIYKQKQTFFINNNLGVRGEHSNLGNLQKGKLYFYRSIFFEVWSLDQQHQHNQETC